MQQHKHDLIFFSGFEWNPFSQRGQSLASEFARRGHRVFFIEPMLSIGRIVHSFAKMNSLALPNTGLKNIFLLRPYLSFSTFRGSRTRFVDRLFFNLWFSGLRKKYDISDDAIVYINMPYWWNNIIDKKLFPHNKLIYDCIDDCKVYSRNNRILEIMEVSEDKLIKQADIVLATAKALYEKLKSVKSSTYLVTNGVDIDRFAKDKKIPEELRSLKRPIFGFVGALYYWIDFGAFEKLAENFTAGSIVLIGPKKSEELERMIDKYENIYYLGPKPYAEIPDYIDSFDVCLNPFKVDKIGDSVNPLKLYDYLSLGKPILSSGTKEMKNFAEYIYIYNDYDELITSAFLAINEANPILKEKRMSFAFQNSWAKKVDEIEKFIM